MSQDFDDSAEPDFGGGEKRTTSQVMPAAAPMMHAMYTTKSSRPKTSSTTNLE